MFDYAWIERMSVLYGDILSIETIMRDDVPVGFLSERVGATRRLLSCPRLQGMALKQIGLS